MSPSELTDRQQEILDFLRDEIDRKGMPPTIREVAVHFEFRSTKAVEDHLAALERKGAIHREKGKSRSIEITGRPDLRGARLVPLIGRIAAGSPVLAVENKEGDFVLDEDLVGSGETFMLRVTGDSMQDASILDGDFVVVRQQENARSGEIVAARLGEEATVKRLHRDGRAITLLPENEAYDPIPVPADEDFQILGKVVGIFRRI